MRKVGSDGNSAVKVNLAQRAAGVVSSGKRNREGNSADMDISNF